MNTNLNLTVIIIGMVLTFSTYLAPAKTVRAFILAGQSNMEGKAKNSLLDFQATDGKTKGHYAHLRKDGKWIVRDDVFIKFFNRKGPLTIGYGSIGRTGIELEFGHAMGEYFDDPVLLIKTAWGGHCLAENFRPPSAGGTVGASYTNMINEFKKVKEDYMKLFPELEGSGFELTGFVWFQGFNDMVKEYKAAEYEKNMKHFINDVRKDLESPDLPFVIAALGTNGVNAPNERMKTVQDAQLAMAKLTNVKAFRTDTLVDKAAAELFPDYKNNQEEWEKVGSDRPYHYFGSGIWYGRIGKEAGKAMVELLPDRGGAKLTAKKEPHTFRSADGSKSFKGVFLSFDTQTGLVKVRKLDGRVSKFKIELLSKKDQEYVRGKR